MVSQLLDGRYQIIEVIETGEFGQTYLAKDIRRPGEPQCFVKHLRPGTTEPKLINTTRRLFQKEAEVLEKLGQHDQIPQLFAYFEENEEFFLVESFVAGHSLSTEIVPGKPLTEEKMIALLKELLEILVFVHGQGVIHRDIKPANLIRRYSDNKLVLIDFGSVKRNSHRSKTSAGNGADWHAGIYADRTISIQPATQQRYLRFGNDWHPSNDGFARLRFAETAGFEKF
jgi:Serine/threonine protein kinase